MPMRIAPIQRMRSAVARERGFGFVPAGCIAKPPLDGCWLSKRRALPPPRVGSGVCPHEMHCGAAPTCSPRTICASPGARSAFASGLALAQSDGTPGGANVFEDLLQLGVGLRVAAVGAYAGAFAGYASSLGLPRRLLKTGASVLAWVGLTAHSAYLVARWFAAGQV